MRILLVAIIIALVSFTGCTDSQSEKLIEGHWHAVKMVENNGNMEHQLPDGIHLNFEYPKYSFEGEQNEEGNYYIKNEQLVLLSDDQEETRKIEILKLTSDSLTLRLVDSTGSRAVQFLRNRE